MTTEVLYRRTNGQHHKLYLFLVAIARHMSIVQIAIILYEQTEQREPDSLLWPTCQLKQQKAGIPENLCESSLWLDESESWFSNRPLLRPYQRQTFISI